MIIMNLPDTLILEIFSYIPLPERWLVVSVCHAWNRICHDPYLYRHLEFNNLEYKTLVLCLQKLVSISPRIKSILINGCYSNFIQNTVVPVHFSQQQQQRSTVNHNGPTLYSHITALQPPRRRHEYLKHNFELHDQFSDAIYQLFCINWNNLNTLIIQDCTLDLEMTELFCIIAGHAHALETFTYINNHDKGIHSSGLLQAIVTATPRMRHFRGLHSGMDDAVLMTIARHWKSLHCLTLCSLKSRDVVLGHHIEMMSIGRQFTGASPTGPISSHNLWQLLSNCHQLTTLELFDLACISNRDLAIFDSMRTQVVDKKESSRIPVHRFSPYIIPQHKKEQPGANIQHLIITKYMTTPLSKPGFESLLNLFPKLDYLRYETNFHTFDNLFEGVTREMFNAECAAVQALFNQHRLNQYIGQWNAGVTAEQRLMASVSSSSSGV